MCPCITFAVCESYLTDVDEAGCELLGLTVNNNTGVCYNGSVPYGFFNKTLAEENKLKAVLPTEDYLK